MSDAEYIRYEMGKARPEPGGVVRIKAAVAEHGGESRWLTLTPDAYERVIDALLRHPRPHRPLPKSLGMGEGGPPDLSSRELT